MNLQERLEKLIINEERKTCPKCGYDAFNLDWTNKEGLVPVCKKCGNRIKMNKKEEKYPSLYYKTFRGPQ